MDDKVVKSEDLVDQESKKLSLSEPELEYTPNPSHEKIGSDAGKCALNSGQTRPVDSIGKLNHMPNDIDKGDVKKDFFQSKTLEFNDPALVLPTPAEITEEDIVPCHSNFSDILSKTVRCEDNYNQSKNNICDMNNDENVIIQDLQNNSLCSTNADSSVEIVPDLKSSSVYKKEENFGSNSELTMEETELILPIITVDENWSHSSSNDSSLYSDSQFEPHINIPDTSKSKENILFKFNEFETDSLSDVDTESELDIPNALLDQKVKSFLKGQKVKLKKSGTNRPEQIGKYYKLQLEFLETTNKKVLTELSETKSKLTLSENEFKNKQMQLKSEFENKLEKLAKVCETLKKEKETMVIRYANSEKEVIFAKKAQNDMEKKFKELNRERENFSIKTKGLQMDKSRIGANLEKKIDELNTIQREQDKLKEDLSCKDIKIKWVQNKLRTEMEAHKETQTKLDHTIQRLNEMREEAEQIRKDCQEMVRCYQEAEEIKSVKLDHQLKQKLSELEVQKQERCDQEEVYQLLKQELEALKVKQRLTIEENTSLTFKIHSLEKERLEYEQTLSKLKDSQNSLKQEVVDLTAHLAEMENTRLLLEREREKFSASVREVDRLRQTNAELQCDMDACHMKEGELLEFTERLTAKTVHLQSEHSGLESKAQALEEEVMQLTKQNLELEQNTAEMANLFEEEKKFRWEETQLLARKLAEKTKTVENLNMNLGELENENQVMKRKYKTSMKELSRELQFCKKKLESWEPCSAIAEITSLGSRASSCASLDTMQVTSQSSTVSNSVTTHTSPAVTFSGGRTHNQNQSSASSTIPPTEVDKQMLIERIVKLQKILAQKNDKIEFLEDTLSQLLREFKKKSRIIQNYIIHTETGALVPNSYDKAKFDISKKGGIMASVYNSHASDDNMTLDLSLEINNKLQAVLEDTLLKNITLKDNMRTLGEDIALLSSEKQELIMQLSIIHKK